MSVIVKHQETGIGERRLIHLLRRQHRFVPERKQLQHPVQQRRTTETPPFGNAEEEMKPAAERLPGTQRQVFVIAFAHHIVVGIGERGFRDRIVDPVQKTPLPGLHQRTGAAQARLLPVRGKHRRHVRGILRHGAGGNAGTIVGKNPVPPLHGGSLRLMAAAPPVPVVADAGNGVLFRDEPGDSLHDQFEPPGADPVVDQLPFHDKKSAAELFDPLLRQKSGAAEMRPLPRHRLLFSVAFDQRRTQFKHPPGHRRLRLPVPFSFSTEIHRYSS